MGADIFGYLGAFAVFVLFCYGLKFQLLERNRDLRQKSFSSKISIWGHRLAIYGFAGFLIFFPLHVLMGLQFISNEVFLAGDTTYIATSLSICFIFLGKIILYFSRKKLPKTLF